MPLNTSSYGLNVPPWFCPVNEAPEWLSRERLPGGFISDELQAGGEIQAWERQAFLQHSCPDRESLNRFFLGNSGRQTLVEHYHRGAFQVEQPEEGALMSLALLDFPTEIPSLLEPYFKKVRFYPRLLQTGFLEPPTGQCFRFSCGEVLESLEGYELPLEVRRKRESLTLWRPLFHRLLALLEETREEGWPFQRYPAGWTAKARELINQIENQISGDVLCAYPHRADSDFCRLLSNLTTACEEPAALTGRDVTFCKGLLEDTLRKRGQLQPTVPSELPGDEVLRAVAEAQEYLKEFPPQSGFTGSPEWLSGLPRTVRRKVLRARQDTPRRLREIGLISSLETLEELAPRLVSGALNCPLLSRSYRAHDRLDSSCAFEALPWIAPAWHPPDPERITTAVSELLSCWWSGFAYRSASPNLTRQLQALARWSGKIDWQNLVEGALPNVNLAHAIEQCSSFLARENEVESSRPYERLRRDKRIGEAEEQLAFFTALQRTDRKPR